MTDAEFLVDDIEWMHPTDARRTRAIAGRIKNLEAVRDAAEHVKIRLFVLRPTEDAVIRDQVIRGCYGVLYAALNAAEEPTE